MSQVKLDQRGRLPRLRALPDAAKGQFSPQPRHETKPRRVHPETHASMGAAGWAQGGGLGACAGTGGRWVQPRRGQVQPCSPATLPAQSAAPHGIDVGRAGLSPAAGSTSGGTGRAGATPARRLGTRGELPPNAAHRGRLPTTVYLPGQLRALLPAHCQP